MSVETIHIRMMMMACTDLLICEMNEIKVKTKVKMIANKKMREE